MTEELYNFLKHVLFVLEDLHRNPGDMSIEADIRALHDELRELLYLDTE